MLAPLLKERIDNSGEAPDTRKTVKFPAGDYSPAFVFLLFFGLPSFGLHVIEDPVPHDEETGNDHVGEQSCTEECSGDDKFVVHLHHPYASSGTESAHVSTLTRIPSSEYEVRDTWSRLKVT